MTLCFVCPSCVIGATQNAVWAPMTLCFLHLQRRRCYPDSRICWGFAPEERRLGSIAGIHFFSPCCFFGRGPKKQFGEGKQVCYYWNNAWAVLGLRLGLIARCRVLGGNRDTVLTMSLTFLSRRLAAGSACGRRPPLHERDAASKESRRYKREPLLQKGAAAGKGSDRHKFHRQIPCCNCKEFAQEFLFCGSPLSTL